MADRFDRFSENAQRTLAFAQEEAQRHGHSYIGTEHLLLGLLRVPEGGGVRVLEALGVEPEKVQKAIEFILGRGSVARETGLTGRAKRAIELAVNEVRRAGSDDIGTEHLLLGLLAEGEGIAAGVLASLSVTLEKARAEVQRLHAGDLPVRSVRTMTGILRELEDIDARLLGVPLTTSEEHALRRAASTALADAAHQLRELRALLERTRDEAQG